jgi:PEP-CTERM motif
MTIRVLPLLLTLCLTMTLPAMAGIVYENGPINGTIDAWTINFGFVMGDSFTISGGPTTITGVAFGAWVSPGDTVTSVEVSLNSQPYLGGTTYFDQMVNFTQTGCAVNQYGFNVCTETGLFNGPTLPNGTYWMSLQNATTTNGDPVYWDENGGIGCHSPGCPSQTWWNSEGTVPSESFSILGTPGGATPEPGSLALVGSGVLGLLGLIRRKL